MGVGVAMRRSRHLIRWQLEQHPRDFSSKSRMRRREQGVERSLQDSQQHIADFGLDPGSFDVLYTGYDQSIDKESFAKIIVDVTAQ